MGVRGPKGTGAGLRGFYPRCTETRVLTLHLGHLGCLPLQALVRLSGCQLLDAQPEDPYSYNVTGAHLWSSLAATGLGVNCLR